jgi:hypothetical protein
MSDNPQRARDPLVPGAMGVQDEPMRFAALSGWALTAVVGLSLGLGAVSLPAAGANPPRPDSGVRGLVLYGPTCPVQRPGQTCTRPYRAWITIKREPSGTLAARVRSAANGRFSARLVAGRYLLEPRNGTPYPRASSRTITISRHRFSTVTIRFDSGIR